MASGILYWIMPGQSLYEWGKWHTVVSVNLHAKEWAQIQFRANSRKTQTLPSNEPCHQFLFMPGTQKTLFYCPCAHEKCTILPHWIGLTLILTPYMHITVCQHSPPTTALLVWTLNKAMVGFTAKSVAERVETPGLRCTQPNKRSAYIDMKQYSCFICVHFRTHALCIRKHA